MTRHSHASLPLDDAIETAEAICRARDENLTPLRKRVLTLLLENNSPAKAYDLLAKIGTQEKQAKPPTVYRALDFLLRMGLVHRIESLNAYVACDLAHPDHAAAFLICDTCGAASEVEAHAVAAALASAAALDGFRVATTVVEAHGQCGPCSEAA